MLEMTSPSLTVERAPSLFTLGAEIRAEHAAVKSTFAESLQHARRAGDLLREAKDQLTHGKWLPWLRDHAVLPERTARLYMQVAANWDRVQAASSLRDAIDALRKPKALPPSKPATPVADLAGSKASKVRARFMAALRDYAQLYASETQAQCERDGEDPRVILAVRVDLLPMSSKGLGSRDFKALAKNNPVAMAADPSREVLIHIGYIDGMDIHNYELNNVERLPRLKG